MAMEHNLARLAEQSYERHGDRESLFFGGRWYRSGDMNRKSNRLSAGLVKLGIKPGDRVVVLMPNSPDVGVCYVALWRAGAVATPAMFLLTDIEVRHIVESSEAVAIITAPELMDKAKAATTGLDCVKWLISTGPTEEGVVSLADLELDGPSTIVNRDATDLAALMFTGGTTGRAKGVMLSHENLWFCGKASYDSSYQPGVNRSLVPLPLAHSFGLIVTVVGMHSVEPGVAVLQSWFDPTDFLQAIQEHKLQGAPVVPSMLQILLMMPLENYDLSSLKYLVCGAAPLAAEVAKEIERRIPSVEVREGYGCTESGAVVSTNPPGKRRLGSVGLPLQGYEVRIVDNDDVDVPRGESGEVIVRSKGVMLGYWKSPDVTADTLKDGWLHTGDIGKLDEDGYLYIVDRKKDLVIRGGFNVFPRDVEDALLEHPSVAAAGVVGKPDQKLGEEVVAFVSLKTGEAVSEQDLIEFAKSKVGAHKYPREVHVVDLIPLTPVGKVDRKSLRKLVTPPPS